eukprot:GHVL01026588.1.p1 GENE.GHVL01026588.1~~GHVL01026588.1.p1  ORF type:complete len:318 (+),score=6.18 GHVL01026588.1:46-999(+)
MTLHIFRAVILLLLVASTVLGEGDLTNINSCTTPETVLEGEAAALTCTYSQNVESDKQDFYIFRSQNGEEPVIVTICAWDEISFKLNCDTKHGYNVMVRAHQVILNISSAQPFHTGNYSCSTLPPAKGQRIEQCSLSVQAKTQTDTMTIVCNKDVSQPSVMCMLSESIDGTIILLESHDLLKNTRPVEVMRCDKRSERCTSPLNGYKITITEKPGNIKVYGVMIPLDAADQNRLYVCKTPEGSSCDMCKLTTDEVPLQPDTDNKIVQTLTVPLYLIVVCMVVIVIIVVVIVLKRCKFKHHRERPPEQLLEQVQLNQA